MPETTQVCSDRPYVVVNCAMSLDGYLDDTGPRRLVLSNEADLDRVDALRAECDAILVGAETVRRDNPRLLVRSEARRDQRLDAGRPESPLKVTLTTSGGLDPRSAFFTTGPASTLVYSPTAALAFVRERIGAVTEVADGGSPLDLSAVLADLARRGVGRVLVEGGSRILTALLVAELVDEMYVAIAPFFLGDAAAPRFVRPGSFPYGAQRPMQLADASRQGDLVVLHYRLRAAS